MVAVFAQGAQWQFKDWRLGNGNPTQIFNKVKGFHLKMSGMPLDANIAKWSVTTIEIDSQKRHLDRAKLLTFWDELDKLEFLSFCFQMEFFGVFYKILIKIDHFFFNKRSYFENCQQYFFGLMTLFNKLHTFSIIIYNFVCYKYNIQFSIKY